MIKNLPNAAACFSIFIITQTASATPVIDQNQPSNTVYMANFSQSDLAQSFQQFSDNISGAGIYLQNDIPSQGVSDTITIEFWDALPDEGGSLLASGSAVGTEGSWVDVFWTPVATTSNTTYYLVFSSLNNVMGIAGDTNNPYANGQVYANNGYGSFPTYDYTFRTYANENQSAVPEPTTMLLFGTGIAGFAAVGRRRK